MKETNRVNNKGGGAKRRGPGAQRPDPGLVDRLRSEQYEYSAADVERLFHLPATLVRALERAAYTTATALEGTTVYGFKDLLVFRAASALRAAGLRPAQVIAAIGKLRETLPPGDLLATLALAAHQNPQTWQPPERLDQTLQTPSPGRSRSAAIIAADEHYARGVELEESDVAAARDAYLDALKLHKHHLEARINLGRLMHLEGKLAEAERIYRQAKNSSAMLSYNLAVLLEDLNREEEAVAAYRQALAQDPDLHDAHFNLARLHERAEQPREALRHLLAYRRRTPKPGE